MLYAAAQLPAAAAAYFLASVLVPLARGGVLCE